MISPRHGSGTRVHLQANHKLTSLLHAADCAQCFGRNNAGVTLDGAGEVILSKSFKGGFADKADQVRGAAATMRYKGKPHYFITVTANPEWIEITRELLPGQTAYDDAELTNRVFRIKLNRLLQLLPDVFGAQVRTARLQEACANVYLSYIRIHRDELPKCITNITFSALSFHMPLCRCT
jgi:hypothetical protein